MSYAITDIISWAKASQALAAIGEGKNLATRSGTIEQSLDVKLYTERISLEYAYAQDQTSDQTFLIGQGVLALCGIYLLEAQGATGSGGSITPITPGTAPTEYDFEVGATTTASAPIKAGDTSVVLPTAWIGYNILFIRGHITQSKINDGSSVYYSWDRTTATLSLLGTPDGIAQLGEPMQIFPII